MADKTITALTGASTPLAGTEVLPIVQSGSTVKATVANIVGAGTSPGSFTNITGSANAIISVTDNTNAALRITQLGTGNALLVEDTTNPDSSPFVIDQAGDVIIGATSSVAGLSAVKSPLQVNNAADIAAAFTRFSNDASDASVQFLKSRNNTYGSQTIVQSGDNSGTIRFGSSDGVAFIQAALISAAVDGTPGTNDMPGRLVFSTTADGASSPTERMRISSTGDVTLSTGNLIQGTAAKGVNFTANSAAAGMTSQLLNWYEQGTWTPAIGGNATYTTQTGRYTRIGRLVTFMCDLTINVAGTGDKGNITGLPYTASGNNPVYVGYFAGLGASVVSISPFVGGTTIALYGLTAAGATASGLNLMGDGARLMCQGSYEV